MSTGSTHIPSKATGPTPVKQENPGAITSDSLAAESSAFQDGNKNSTPLSVKGASSTFANTDTSGATKLDPASDAEARKAEEDWSKEQTSGSNATSYQTQSNTSAPSKTGEYNTTSSSSGGTAPSYVHSSLDTSGPKGQNLKEGGFTSDDKKNASFNSDIGDKNDPSRLAEQKMFSGNAGPKLASQEGDMGENVYEKLGGDTEA